MAVVLKPFPFAGDGHSVERLEPGDERYFGALTAGLVDEGYVAEESAAEPEVPMTRAKGKA